MSWFCHGANFCAFGNDPTDFFFIQTVYISDVFNLRDKSGQHITFYEPSNCTKLVKAQNGFKISRIKLKDVNEKDFHCDLPINNYFNEVLYDL